MTPERPKKRSAARRVAPAGPGNALSAGADDSGLTPAGSGAALSTSGATASPANSSNAAPAGGTAEKGTPMAEFTVNPHRQDAYKNFKFRVRWDNQVIPGVCRISCLKRSTEPVEHRDGAEPSQSHTSPGVWKFAPIVMERGITHDTAFEDWANLSYSVGAPMSLKNFRKDIVIELLNEQGVLVKAFRVYRCWVSEYQVLPALDANDGAVAIESITVENEGWERDTAITEPTET